MQDSKNPGRAQDGARVAGSQDYEVKHADGKTGASAKAVKDAVKDVGNSRAKAEGKLGK